MQYNKFSKNINLNKEDECYCNLEYFKDFIDPYHGHIVTGDLNILEDVNLKKIMSLGSDFRLNFNYSNWKIIDLKEKESDFFILRISYKYSWPFEDFRNRKFNILDLFKKDFLLYRNFYKRNLDEIQHNKKLKNSIANLKDKFIVDKANSNFALICKAFY